jgi:hypothetical protein
LCSTSGGRLIGRCRSGTAREVGGRSRVAAGGSRAAAGTGRKGVHERPFPPGLVGGGDLEQARRSNLLRLGAALVEQVGEPGGELLELLDRRALQEARGAPVEPVRLGDGPSELHVLVHDAASTSCGTPEVPSMPAVTALPSVTATPSTTAEPAELFDAAPE